MSDYTSAPMNGLFISGELQNHGTYFFLVVLAHPKARGWRRYEHHKTETEEQALAIFATLDARAGEHKAKLARRAAERSVWRKKALEETKAKIVPGVLLHGSWGYDQTNCELFEVVAVSGIKVTVRGVRCETAEVTGPYGQKLKPVRDETLPTQVMTMVPGGVKYSDHCTLTPADWNKTYYDSRGQH